MTTELLHFLRGKLAEAEQSLLAREQAQSTWASGTDESWAQAALLHPDTASASPIKKAERIRNAEAQKRIAARCRHDVEMFKAAITAIAATAQ